VHSTEASNGMLGWECGAANSSVVMFNISGSPAAWSGQVKPALLEEALFSLPAV
jgi:hypothetical protein